jgi:hypothetical protein
MRITIIRGSPIRSCQINRQEISLKREFRTNSAYCLGSTVHYGGKDFFVTATFLRHLLGAKDYTNTGSDSYVVNGISNADDFEEYRLRIKASIYF